MPFQIVPYSRSFTFIVTYFENFYQKRTNSEQVEARAQLDAGESEKRHSFHHHHCPYHQHRLQPADSILATENWFGKTNKLPNREKTICTLRCLPDYRVLPPVCLAWRRRIHLAPAHERKLMECNRLSAHRQSVGETPDEQRGRLKK